MTSPIGKRYRSNPSSGFTLIELLFVVLILVIILGIALPRFQGTFEKLQVQTAARNIYKLMLFAQERAIFEQKTYRVRYERDERRVLLERKSGKKFFPVQSRLAKPVHIKEAVTVKWNRTPPQITFTPTGESGTLKVTFYDQTDRLYTLTAGKPLGRIVLEDEN